MPYESLWGKEGEGIAMIEITEQNIKIGTRMSDVG